jgi:hypothetical protein
MLFFGFRNLKTPRLVDCLERAMDLLTSSHQDAPDDHA